MHKIATDLPEVWLLQQQVHHDARGWFKECFRFADLQQILPEIQPLVQANASVSAKGVLRGLHWQRAPYAQAKLIELVSGETYTVAVDIRPDSARFACWTALHLQVQHHQMLWIPEGFAHGFLALSEATCLRYHTSHYYHPAYAMSVAWNSPQINISWPTLDVPLVLSEQDALAPQYIAT